MQSVWIKAASILLFSVGIIFFMFVDQARNHNSITTNTAQISATNPYLTSRQHWNNTNKLFLKEYIDLEDDNSLYTYISNKKTLNNLKYNPAMLVDVSSDDIIQRSR